MRMILGVGTLGVLMLATALGQQVQPPVTCDGTSAVKGKCDGGVKPAGYFESLECQTDELPVGSTCQNAIAFNQDNFTCSAPVANPNTNPKQYTTYCVDITPPVTCTIRRICAQRTITRADNTQYVECFRDTRYADIITTRYAKATFSYDLPTPNGCQPVLVNP